MTLRNLIIFVIICRDCLIRFIIHQVLLLNCFDHPFFWVSLFICRKVRSLRNDVCSIVATAYRAFIQIGRLILSVLKLHKKNLLISTKFRNSFLQLFNLNLFLLVFSNLLGKLLANLKKCIF